MFSVTRVASTAVGRITRTIGLACASDEPKLRDCIAFRTGDGESGKPRKIPAQTARKLLKSASAQLGARPKPGAAKTKASAQPESTSAVVHWKVAYSGKTSEGDLGPGDPVTALMQLEMRLARELDR